MKNLVNKNNYTIKFNTLSLWLILPVLLFSLLFFPLDSFAGASNSSFSQIAKLIALDGDAIDRFGDNVSVSGDTIVVAAPFDEENGFLSGSVYIFERNQGGDDNWGQVKKILAFHNSVRPIFGNSVQIEGDTLIVGATGDDQQVRNSGAAYIFERNQGGDDNWGQVKKIKALDRFADDLFGTSVGISEDTVIVGAHHDDDNGGNSGSAYIFERNQGGDDNWGQVKKITASDGATRDEFGENVAISIDVVIVGSHFNDAHGITSGSAYIFERNQGGDDNWGEVKKITASDGESGDFFGESVAISGHTVVVGAPGSVFSDLSSESAYIFERNQGGDDNWGEVKKINALDSAVDDTFGESVGISGDTVIVGARLDDDNGGNSGSAYIFERNQGGDDNWGEVKKITASDGAAIDLFGESVAIWGQTVVVGAINDDDNGLDSGSAYVFSSASNGDKQKKSCDALERAEENGNGKKKGIPIAKENNMCN